MKEHEMLALRPFVYRRQGPKYGSLILTQARLENIEGFGQRHGEPNSFRGFRGFKCFNTQPRTLQFQGIVCQLAYK